MAVMPARIVVVHDDPGFIEDAAAALWAAGYDVAAFSDSMTALLALEAAQSVELLITHVTFPSGPNGVSLALVAKNRRPGLRVLFTAQPESQPYTVGVGEFLPAPVSAAELVEAIGRMLST